MPKVLKSMDRRKRSYRFPLPREQRLEEIQRIATSLISTMLEVIAGKPRAFEGHGLEDMGKKRGAGTWCNWPRENHSEVDSELVALIDEHVLLLVKALDDWEKEVRLLSQEHVIDNMITTVCPIPDNSPLSCRV